ncbi:4-hydroxy-tetrahydrodipicolinate reductase [Ancylobacter pratisalsi]|uniref:4-hydroxy-tetrahydrodipicolinate reductase n=1 Tax=Ancylobacter pratisalsi TaxID=1745854 RepID=A0A6P1YL91_9HYPH|nr:4-hydroxy-tetrahydrodipicolinate reductase [Ancylobacter pratisalsi]QIB33461.1 4-hydroxy-tetrahydrodipicolinate reductase [Ancylobacter pratisalsi]
MSLRIILAGATGWVGRALVPALAAAPDLDLVAAISRSHAGTDLGGALGGGPSGVPVFAGIADALAIPADVLIDYTKPDVVKANSLAALKAGLAVVIGTSGLGSADFAELDIVAREQGLGVLAAGNFSITATLMKRFTLEAAKYVADVELIDYASAKKPDAPSGTARELAETLSALRQPATSRPVADVMGVPATRGGAFGEGDREVRVHALRMPSFTLAVESIFGAPDERLTIRHDAGSSAAPYVAGTLLAARRVGGWTGVRRGLDTLLD